MERLKHKFLIFGKAGPLGLALTIVLILGLILLVLFSGQWRNNGTLTETPLRTPNPWGITLPKALDSVPGTFTASGTYDASQLGGGELWIFIQPIDGEYYPQASCDPPRTAIIAHPAEGTWEISVDLSVAPSDSGSHFDLILSRTTIPRKKEFMDYIQSWCNTQVATGLVLLKNYGLYEVASTTVRYEG